MGGSTRRWADWAALVASAVGICLLLHGVFRSVGAFVTGFLDNWPSWFSYVFAVAVPALFAFLLCRMRALHPGHLTRLVARYPPAWLAGLTGAGIYLAIVWAASPLGRAGTVGLADATKAFAFGLLGTAVTLLLRMAWAWGGRRRSRPGATETNRSDGLQGILNDPTAMDRWLRNEEPIASPQDDMFGYARIARRVARLLFESEPKTVGIVGPFGCGKTSLLNLVEYYLERPPEVPPPVRQDPTHDSPTGKRTPVLVCRAAGWGLQEGAVAERILSAVLGALATRIDCLGISMLPREYAAALSELGSGWLRCAAGVLTPPARAEDVLGRLDPILDAIGRNLVVFVEDMERNPSSSGAAELAALLDRLRPLKRVSFVLATSERSPTALPRICERIESLPALPLQQVIPVIEGFRSRELERYGDVNLGQGEARKLWVENQELLGMAAAEGLIPAAKAIALFLRVPRALKSVLRRVSEVWRSLHGEIRFDHLLVAVVLRTGVPEAFDFILQNIETLRLLGKQRAGTDQQRLKERLKEAWDAATAGSETDKASARELVDVLFSNFSASPLPLAQESAQAVAVDWPTDYWRRLNAEEVDAEEVSDQAAVRAIRDWQEANEALVHEGLSLPEMVFSREDWANKVEQFWGLLTGEQVRDLATALFALALERRGPRASGEAVGLVNVWRMSLDLGLPGRAVWLLREVSKAIPVSLRFANHILYYWTCEHPGHESDSRFTPELRAGLAKTAREALEGKPDVLAGAMDPDDPWVVTHLVHYFPADHGLRDLSWLGETLLAAAREAPEVVLPQMACLLTEGSHVRDRPEELRWAHSFSEDQARDLLGDRVPVLMELFANLDMDVAKFDDQAQSAIREAVGFARRWLPERPAGEAGGAEPTAPSEQDDP